MLMGIIVDLNRDDQCDQADQKFNSTFLVRFLSWALHIFAFDLAYEPEGWPWKPVNKLQLNGICVPYFLMG